MSLNAIITENICEGDKCWWNLVMGVIHVSPYNKKIKNSDDQVEFCYIYYTGSAFGHTSKTHIIKQVSGSVRRPSFWHKACKRHPVQHFNEEVVLCQRPLTQEGSLRKQATLIKSSFHLVHTHTSYSLERTVRDFGAVLVCCTVQRTLWKRITGSGWIRMMCKHQR